MTERFRVIPAGEFARGRRPTAAKEVEEAYRRAYVHGYSAALQDVLKMIGAGYSRPKEVYSTLHDFLSETLLAWRCGTGFQEPPQFEVESWSSVRRSIIERDGAECCFCGATHRLSADHITPVHKFGTAAPENLRVLCQPCNNLRNGADLV